ncbi:MAG: riboflavin biosynthesis protein RibF, partial [Ignavibacteria bacterium]|nr:riboflavin biosynthesis protein RibF [Ignavibacteria bacterium]
HMFGRNREGNFEMMKLLSDKFGFTVDRVDEFRSDGEHVSSTRIRHLLESGDVRNAARMLGREYSLSGTVAEGRKLGRELGMPTANIVPDSDYKLIPLDGIYAVKVRIGDDEYGGVMNIGTNPTVTDDKSKKIEVNLFDFDGDLYGKDLTVGFVDRLRSEQKFSDLDELRSAMQEDKAKAREILRLETEKEFNNKITKAN